MTLEYFKGWLDGFKDGVGANTALGSQIQAIEAMLTRASEFEEQRKQRSASFNGLSDYQPRKLI